MCDDNEIFNQIFSNKNFSKDLLEPISLCVGTLQSVIEGSVDKKKVILID